MNGPKCDESVEYERAAKAITSTEQTIATTSTLAPKLEKVANKRLEKADPKNRRTFGPILRAQTAIVGHALMTQVRVDETKMCALRPDHLTVLLRIVAEEELKLRSLPDQGERSGSE